MRAFSNSIITQPYLSRVIPPVDDGDRDGEDEDYIHYVRLSSDIHLEHRKPNTSVPTALEEAIPSDPKDKHSLLILAGDIAVSRRDLSDTYAILCDRFDSVMHIPGNHEFWAHDIIDWTEFAEQQEEIHKNLSVIQVPSCYYDVFPTSVGNLLVVPAILWTDQNNFKPTSVMRTSGWPDFRNIRFNRKPFTPEAMVSLHNCDKSFLETTLVEARPGDFPAGILVATHYLPSFKLCVQGERAFDHMFASDLDHMLVAPWAPDLWAHGHTHTKIDTYLGSTRILANPKGYPGEISGPVQKLIIPVGDIKRKIVDAPSTPNAPPPTIIS